jgi:hypothetical protein
MAILVPVNRNRGILTSLLYNCTLCKNKLVKTTHKLAVIQKLAILHPIFEIFKYTKI